MIPLVRAQAGEDPVFEATEDFVCAGMPKRTKKGVDPSISKRAAPQLEGCGPGCDAEIEFRRFAYWRAASTASSSEAMRA